MRAKSVVLPVIVIGLLLGAGCKSSTGPEDEDDFVGTWRATKAEYTSVATPANKVDIIAAGSTLTLVLSTSTAVLTITDPGESPVVLNANWSASVDVLTLTWTSGSSGETQFDYTLDGDELTMTGGHMPFDFTPGVPEEAILDLILVRQ